MVRARAMKHYAAERRNVGFPRWADIVVASAILLITCPLFAVIAVLIRLSSPGPVFFRYSEWSVRYGLYGRRFQWWRFRTMLVEAYRCIPQEPFVCLTLDKEKRFATAVGRLLRKSGLDELPLFLNVLAGDMSVFGPKPFRPADAERIKDDYPFLFSVKPGVISPWRVDRYKVMRSGTTSLGRIVQRTSNLRLRLWAEEQFVKELADMNAMRFIRLFGRFVVTLLVRIPLPLVEEATGVHGKGNGKPVTLITSRHGVIQEIQPRREELMAVGGGHVVFHRLVDVPVGPAAEPWSEGSKIPGGLDRPRTGRTVRHPRGARSIGIQDEDESAPAQAARRERRPVLMVCLGVAAFAVWNVYSLGRFVLVGAVPTLHPGLHVLGAVGSVGLIMTAIRVLRDIARAHMVGQRNPKS